MTVTFRCKLVLMIMGAYGFGDHVRDDRAFWLRCRSLRRLQSKRKAIREIADDVI